MTGEQAVHSPQAGIKYCKRTEFYSFPSALNLFFMCSIALLFSQISTGYELDSEKSVECRQWWKRQRAWERCSIAKPAVNISIAQESSNHPMVCVWPNYLQCLPIGSSIRVVKPNQYICNTSALKIKIKLRWLYILARGKNVVFLYIPFLSVLLCCVFLEVFLWSKLFQHALMLPACLIYHGTVQKREF